MSKLVNAWVFDIEQAPNLHTNTLMRLHTKEVLTFVVHPGRNERDKYKRFLDTKPMLIGFNNLTYDYPVVNKFFTEGYRKVNPNDLLYPTSKRIIESGSKKTIYDPPHRQVDLFRIQHFDNGARSTSLKGLMVNFHMLNVQELPFKYDQLIELDEIPKILDYNLNDVDATYQLWEYTRKKMALRIELKRKYGIDMMNMPDASIGEKIIISLYCKRTGDTEDAIRARIVSPTKIHLNPCIHQLSKDILLKTPFNTALNKLSAKIITPESTRKKKKGEFRVNFAGVAVEFGLGGIHGSRRGVFTAGNGYVIKDQDVPSLYPNMAGALNFSIAHLNHQVYLDIYDGEIIGVRMAEKEKPKELQDKTIVSGYKLAANGAYGKSNSQYSLLYDPTYTMKTTLNGQFLVAGLVYNLMSKLTTATLIQINTDGVTIKVHESELPQYYQILEDWKKFTGLGLEESEYSKMYVADVNNYGAMKIGELGKLLAKPKPKYKGRFEVELDEDFLHKNRSFVVVRRALAEYFWNGMNPDSYVMAQKEVWDFLGRAKFNKGDWGEIGGKKTQSMCRYYYSTRGEAFIKYMTVKKDTKTLKKGQIKQERIGGKYVVKEANKLETTDLPTDINHKYYIRRIWKEIQDMEGVGQFTLDYGQERKHITNIG